MNTRRFPPLFPLSTTATKQPMMYTAIAIISQSPYLVMWTPFFA